MSFDAFLKVEGIPGESTDDKHKDWIEVLSFSWGVTQSASASTSGGATAERADFQDFSIVKRLDRASPKLALACASGTDIKTVTLELCRPGVEKDKFMEYKMTDCIVSAFSDSGGPAGGAQESISFNYGKIQWTYTQERRAGGSGGGQVAAGWDLQLNKKL